MAEIILSIENENNIVLKDTFVTEYRSLVKELFDKELIPCKGVIEFLKQNELSICVASSGPKQKINHALNVTDLKQYLGNNVFSSYELILEPDPEIFLHAANEMGFSPNECLVIEDSIKGVKQD